MNTQKIRTLFAALCSLTLFALPAAFAGHDAEKIFKQMDTDGDGKVTRAEHTAAGKDMFKKWDANKDSIVTADEIDAAISAKSEKSDKHDKTSAEMIKEIDSNGNGQLSYAEFEAAGEKIFAQLDTNGDGALSKEECAEGHKEKKKDM